MTTASTVRTCPECGAAAPIHAADCPVYRAGQQRLADARARAESVRPKEVIVINAKSAGLFWAIFCPVFVALLVMALIQVLIAAAFIEDAHNKAEKQSADLARQLDAIYPRRR